MPTVDRAPAPELLQALDDEQRAAAEATTGPVAILAGPGSGKTRAISHRIAWQVATGVALPSQVLAVTFTDRAAAELRRRLASLGIEAPVRAATFHAAAWAQLRYFWPRISTAPLPQVLPSKAPLLAEAARRLGVEVRDLAAEIEWAKAHTFDPEAYARHAGRRDTPVAASVMAEVYADYEQAKAAAGAIDFEDMLLVTTRLLVDHPDVAAEVRDRYRYLTVDEFQDVNRAQWTLLSAWLGDSDELCVVGDDDQSIYSFTGASPAYLTGFRRRFPTARIIALSRCYRCSPQILRAATNLLVGKPAELRKRLSAVADPGPEPVVTAFADHDAEVQGVVARIAELISGGADPSGIAVCYRISSQSEAFEEALGQAGIHYAVRGDASFFARPEVRQALRALRAAVGRPARPHDPARSVADALRAPPAPVPPARRVERVLRDSLSFDPRKAPRGRAAAERWRNLAAVVQLARDAPPDLDFAGLVVDLERRARLQPGTPGNDAVSLLTLHRAKGLEFDTVFIVGMEEGLLPITYAVREDEIREERRLLYVGMTRARQRLELSWARSRPTARGRRAQRTPSRFLPLVTAPTR